MKGRRVAQLQRLLRNDKIQVTRIEVAAHDTREDRVYVLFENREGEIAKDRANLKQLKAKAESVAEDKVYLKLSNARQRELYLLDHFGLSKRECVDVVELVKMLELESSTEAGVKEKRKDDEKI